jgi:hypothetical protein
MRASSVECHQTTCADSFWLNWGWPGITALALTPLALVAHSYKFVNDDQILYIPFLRRRLESSLYPGDYFFGQPQASISLFEDALVWPVRWLGLDWTMLLGYLVAQVSILLCLHSLARRLALHRAAYLAMILFILPVSIGGTYVRTYDNYFNPRTFTLPLGLLALAALWERRPWRAAILASLHLYLHPLSGLHVWLVTALMVAWWAWKGFLPSRSLVGPAALLLAGLGVLGWNSGGGPLWLDTTWREVLWQRTPYVFLASWQAEDWISMGLYLLLGALGWRSLRPDPRSTHLSLAVMVVVLGATLSVFLGADLLGLAPLAQLQLARSWRLIIVLAVIFGANLALTLHEWGGWGSASCAALLGVAIYFDRADAKWQPVLAVLLAAVLISWAIRSHQKDKLRWAAESILALASMGLVLPTLLATWPAAEGWVPAIFADRWRLPDEALWPAILLFGFLLVAKTLYRGQRHTLANWAHAGIGSVLVLAALLPIAGEWRQRDWSAYLSDRLQLPTDDAWMSPTFQAWRDVQLWAAVHTPWGARFATDPDEKGFRVFSERSPIVEVKDGASAMFSRAYALEWDRRMQAMAATGVVDPDGKTELASFSEEGLLDLHGLYPFDYVVGRQSQNLPWPEVYRNQEFVVYAWPETDRR